VQSIGDLLSMQSVNAAVVQSDVLANFKRTQRIPGIQSKLQYITRLYSEEVHVLARMQFMCLADLNGRRVSFGAQGSGAAERGDPESAAVDRGDGLVESTHRRHVSLVGPTGGEGDVPGPEQLAVADEGVLVVARDKLHACEVDVAGQDVVDVVAGLRRAAASRKGERVRRDPTAPGARDADGGARHRLRGWGDGRGHRAGTS
jgi:hypothetical protein